ncbi:Probable transcriptional regulatory protein YebC [Urinicoccus massiliensis]|uniref:Probable transcriptional regulatory protein NCTC13150_00541 n=1 Tax=Urinicoccus massiliensis TaxID=1723382 RepID=A0A8H2M6G3_9FIRM|nr:YebC/PmpR family DNA-binding transcriptional regulator [Urinicoccus massiliensis]KGF10270.1 transcriptional regulator [Tissierellia bacterium S5-A11]VFB16027.1 Probable transcriptional regulatory protein YebC [Urinicoccus massiliensis]
MSGHSKWNNIKNKKGKEDAKKGRVFTKMARYIMVAAREGGGDPEYNPSLKMAIDKAKSYNMPNDNIERAIKKGTGEDDDTHYEEVTYEGYGPSGIAVMVKTLTDNRNRTAPEMRHAFDRNGGNLGTSGCVSFMFDKRGVLYFEKEEGLDLDEVMMVAIDSGAGDVDGDDDGLEITTSPEDFAAVRDALEEAGYSPKMAEITYIPQNEVELTSEEDVKKMEKLIDALEDNDDVQDIYHNWKEPDED